MILDEIFHDIDERAKNLSDPENFFIVTQFARLVFELKQKLKENEDYKTLEKLEMKCLLHGKILSDSNQLKLHFPSVWHAALFLDYYYKEAKHNETLLLLRGQSNIDWSISASLFRKGINIQKEFDATQLFINILANVNNTIFKTFLPMKNHIATAQHYGLSTSLLDVTFDPLIALSFANGYWDNNEKDLGVVYLFEHINESEFSVILPPYYCKNLYEQSGMFIDLSKYHEIDKTYPGIITFIKDKDFNKFEYIKKDSENNYLYELASWCREKIKKENDNFKITLEYVKKSVDEFNKYYGSEILERKFNSTWDDVEEFDEFVNLSFDFIISLCTYKKTNNQLEVIESVITTITNKNPEFCLVISNYLQILINEDIEKYKKYSKLIKMLNSTAHKKFINNIYNEEYDYNLPIYRKMIHEHLIYKFNTGNDLPPTYKFMDEILLAAWYKHIRKVKKIQ